VKKTPQIMKLGLTYFVTATDKEAFREYHVWKLDGETVADGGKILEMKPYEKRMYRKLEFIYCA
jgi:hypothetical protein